MEKRLVEIIRAALHYGVSDVYFTLKNDEVIIEMKIKNKLVNIKTKSNDESFFRYLQYRSNLDVGNITLPQTGQFEIEIDKIMVSLRFASVNTYQLTTGVLRVLSNTNNYSVDDLCQSLQMIHYFRKIPLNKSGLFVFSGPTGSGKTTALYTILNEMKSKKIFTLEDPIEVYSQNYVQIQINEKQHMDYASGIKQLMRHAPDVIMIGEIRDEDAATMAVRCALTGHLVLTSIHSSSCVLAIERLVELGVQRNQLQDVLKGITNQRLLLSTDKINKVAVYEKMDRKELVYYFANKKLSEEFSSINEEVKKALSKGIISYDDIQEEFDE
ncbi:MAG: ATPase, T2SS/T4P/T4SS family [Anaerorhabdus sp.]